VHRLPWYQGRLFKKGRDADGNIVDRKKVVTYVDGIVKKSDHNKFPTWAVDVAIVVDGAISWDPKYYAPLGALCEKHGLKWGGHWTKPKDRPHIYWRAS